MRLIGLQRALRINTGDTNIANRVEKQSAKIQAQGLLFSAAIVAAVILAACPYAAFLTNLFSTVVAVALDSARACIV